MKTEICKIYETRDYDMFKSLEGNRMDGERRGRKIIESIRRNGYILSPITINEKNEVIDGQGRLFALKELGMPVHYYIAVGAGIEDCIAMNIYGERWKITDYISSYANRGNDDYIRLNKLINEFKQFGTMTVIRASSNTSAYSHNNSLTKNLQTGTYKLPKTNEVNARNALVLLTRAWSGIKKIRGRTDLTSCAFMWIVTYEKGLDVNKLIDRIEMMAGDIVPIAKTEQALKEFSRIYNYKSRSEKKYFDVDYDKFLRNEYGWYGPRKDNEGWSNAK